MAGTAVEMKMIDYESGRELTDVSVVLTEDELKELSAYVQKLDHDRHVPCAHLSRFEGTHISAELSLSVESRICRCPGS